MSFIRKASNSLGTVVSQTIDPSTYRSKDFYFFNSDGTDYKIEFTGQNCSLKAYMKCSPLSSVINKKAKAYLSGKTWILNRKGKAREKEATSEVANKVRALLENPNPFQSQKEFEAQMYVYVQLFGWSIIFAGSKPVGYDFTEAKRLWNIPPSIINVEKTKKNWLLAESNKDIIKKITISFGSEETELPLDSCYIVKDSTVSITSFPFPESRATLLADPINNIIGAMESRGKLIDYRGALGIISPDNSGNGNIGPVKLLDDDKEAIQQDFLKYGMKKGQFSFILSSAAIKWSQMGIATKDLMLFEEVEDDIMRICDGYDYPYSLMANSRNNNLGGDIQTAGQKALYQLAIIPEAENFCEQLNKMFELAKYELKIEKGYNHVSALQEDEQKSAAARKTRNEAMQIEFYNNLCTLNQWRIANGDDPVNAASGELQNPGDMFYFELLKAGWAFGTSKPATITPQNETAA